MSYLNLPFVSLPKEFCDLLVLTLTDTRKDFTLIIDTLTQDKATQLILSQIADFYNVKSVSDYLNIHGWLNLRNNLASYYISKTIFNKFPQRPDLTLIQDLLDFEERFNWMSPKGQSRLFLFGFYLKVVSIQFQKSGELQRQKEVQIPSSIDQYLKSTKAKTVEPDILLIFCWFYFLKFNHLNFSQNHFKTIYSSLAQDDKYKLLQNYLHYAGSVHHDEFIISDRI